MLVEDRVLATELVEVTPGRTVPDVGVLGDDAKRGAFARRPINMGGPGRWTGLGSQMAPFKR